MFANYVIKSFKHDGSSHRMWTHASLLREDDGFYYLCGLRTKVVEHDGREWRAPQGALYILSKKRFYNAIVMFISPTEISYYINLASPTINLAANVIGFVDYDLDLKRDAKGQVREIDWGEYGTNSRLYGYSDKLKEVIERSFYETKALLASGGHPFDDAENRKMFEDFRKDAAHPACVC